MIRSRLRDDLAAAMRAKDRAATEALRTALSALANAEAVDPSTVARGATEVDRRDVDEAEVRAILAAEADGRRSSADAMRSLGRDAEADVLLRQADLLAAYLAD